MTKHQQDKMSHPEKKEFWLPSAFVEVCADQTFKKPDDTHVISADWVEAEIKLHNELNRKLANHNADYSAEINRLVYELDKSRSDHMQVISRLESELADSKKQVQELVEALRWITKAEIHNDATRSFHGLKIYAERVLQEWGEK